MEKTKVFFEAGIVPSVGGWRVWINGIVSRCVYTKLQAEELLHIRFKASQAQYGEGYEVVLKKIA